MKTITEKKIKVFKKSKNIKQIKTAPAMSYKTKNTFIKRILSDPLLQENDLKKAEDFLLKIVLKSPKEYGELFSYFQKTYKTKTTNKEPLITGLALIHRLAIKDMEGFYILLNELVWMEKEYLRETPYWQYALCIASFIEQGLYHKIISEPLPSKEFKTFLPFFKITKNENKKTEPKKRKRDLYWNGIDLCLSISKSLEKEI